MYHPAASAYLRQYTDVNGARNGHVDPCLALYGELRIMIGYYSLGHDYTMPSI